MEVAMYVPLHMKKSPSSPHFFLVALDEHTMHIYL